MKRMKNLRRLIAKELSQKNCQPRRAKELARHLGIEKSLHREFRQTLKEMEAEGLVSRLKGGRWSPPLPDETITGVIEVTRSGCGFLLPDDPAHDDLYIPEHALGSALNKDRVKVRIEKESGRGYRRLGNVVEVLERASPRIVATIVSGGKARPEDPKNPFDYVVEGEAPEPDYKILLEITVWPGDGAEPAGKVIEVLGKAGEPDTETAAILSTHDAPGPFPDNVKNEVRDISRILPEKEKKQRLDLTELVTLTIDPKDAKDFDDALSWELRDDGTEVVGIHIADVSYFVRPGTGLDTEAKERSTSIYTPGRVIPMLPEELSNDLCSLRPDEEHLTKTVFIHYDSEGKIKNSHIHRSIIRSKRRFTYEEVRDLLTAEEAEITEDPEIMKSLRGLYGLAARLREARLNNDSIELNLPEFKVIIGEDGYAEDIVKVEHDFSHQLVEDFMLAANIELARWCKANDMPVLHRVHAPPSDDRMEDLAEFLTASGYPLKAPFHRSKLIHIIEAARDKPEEHSVNLAILKSFKQAIYHPDGNTGHFALNFPHYMHFTSPIRRYPDLHLHQMLEDVFSPGADKLPKKLRKRPAKTKYQVLETLGTHTSQRERRAMVIEEEIKDFRRLELLSHKEQREFTAVVTGIRKFGIFVEIEDYFVEGMLPRGMLEKKGFSSREDLPGKKKKRAVRPGFHLGQEIRVRITDIDLPARICTMELI